ncbi:MAG: hypothetical protein K8R46_06390, partial [Pirellulales bacterium]|nr:hypothetical protein [Pirellulales bacterium]
MNLGRIEIPFGAQNLIIESGKLAKQANGAVTVTCGGTVVLVTACMAKKPRGGIDFFPLMVDYQEKTYSAGRIPGGFFKREGRPTQKEILTCRVIDRPLRPLFPEGLFNDVQVVASVLSSDGENDPDVLALVGASAALMVSDIPFFGPVGAVRVGMIDDELILNPTYEEREECVLEMVIAGQENGVNMIEGEADMVPEEAVLKAIEFAFNALVPVAKIQEELRKEIGKPKAEVACVPTNEKLLNKLREMTKDQVMKVYQIDVKEEREEALAELLSGTTQDMSVFDDCKRDETDEIKEGEIRRLFDVIEYEE